MFLLKNKIIKISSLVVVAIVVLLLLLNSLISFLGKNYINNHGKDLIGRTISLEDLSVNLFSGNLSLDKLVIKEADDESTFASINHFDTKLSLPYLLTGTYKLNRFEVSGFILNISQSDTIFNFSDIIDYFNQSEDINEEPSESLPLIVDDIKFRNCFLHYKDLKGGTFYNLNNYSLRIPGIDLRNLKNNSAKLQFVDGGYLASTMNYDDKLRRYDLKLEVSSFNLSGLLPFIQQYANTSSISGIFDGNINIKGNLENLLNPVVSGTASVSDFIILDNEDNGVFGANRINFEIKNFDLVDNQIGLSTLLIENPSIHYTLNNDSIDNLTLLLNVTNPVADDSYLIEDSLATSESSSDFNILIDKLQINDGIVYYRDETFNTKPFEYNISNIVVRSNNFNLNKRNRLSASAILMNSGQGRLVYDGKIDDVSNSNISVEIDKLSIKEFTPYSLQLVGYPISNGLLSVKSNTSIVNNQLSGDNNIILKKPSVEDRDKSIEPEYKIPLKFGIYCLTDKNDICNLNLPVSGDLENPEFSYKKALIKVLGQLLSKVATTPFRKLGGKDDDSENITFSSISSEMSIEEISRIDTLVNLLANNTEMKLDMCLKIDKNSSIDDCRSKMAIRDFIISKDATKESVKITDFDQHELLLVDINSIDFLQFINNSLVEKSVEIGNNADLKEKIAKLYNNDAVLPIVTAFIYKKIQTIKSKVKDSGVINRFNVTSELIESKKSFENYYTFNFEEI